MNLRRGVEPCGASLNQVGKYGVTLAMRFFDERESWCGCRQSDFLERSGVESGRPWCSSSGVLFVSSVLEFVEHPCFLWNFRFCRRRIC